MATHILLAIDGTGSALWRDPSGQNSHVYRFYRDAHTPYCLYLDGPDTIGFDMSNIIETGTKWILNQISQLATRKIARPDEVKIDLVGHSRGGVAVIKIANNLNNLAAYEARTNFQTLQLLKGLPLSFKVNFLGLYDAVSRSADTFFDAGNLDVKHIFHARRANRAFFSSSHPLFGGVSTRNQQEYDTSHGGIGGAPGFFDEMKFGNDMYCNALPLLTEPSQNEALSNPVHMMYVAKWLDGEDRPNKLKKYWQASVKVDQDMRINAKEAGIGLNTSLHTPWHNKERMLGKRLSEILAMYPVTTS